MRNSVSMHYMPVSVCKLPDSVDSAVATRRVNLYVLTFRVTQLDTLFLQLLSRAPVVLFVSLYFSKHTLFIYHIILSPIQGTPSIVSTMPWCLIHAVTSDMWYPVRCPCQWCLAFCIMSSGLLLPYAELFLRRRLECLFILAACTYIHIVFSSVENLLRSSL